MLRFQTSRDNIACADDGCCTTQPKGKESCPTCAHTAKRVPYETLDHLLNAEGKERAGSLEGFYYCKTPECDVVYFRGMETLTQKDMTVTVGLKEGAHPQTLCYCFGWTREMVDKEIDVTGTTRALDDIKKKMVDPGCSCERLNPSGGCCLGDINQAIKGIQISSPLLRYRIT